MSARIYSKVIIADDEPDSRTLFRRILRNLNCDLVGEAANGEELLNLFRRKKPDLVLLDYHMPIKNGFETLRELRALDPNVTIIMLTVEGDKDKVHECITNGANDYILKSTSANIMRSRIEKFL